MTVAFVLGNGVSRRGLDLVQIRNHGFIYGCNGLYRDYTPDVLVATDRPIATKIQDTGYALKHRFHTRKPLNGLGGLTIPDKYYGYSSGPVALALASLDKNSIIYFVGFDIGPNSNEKFNNVYADTEFYKTSNSTPTFTGNWIRQIKTVMNNFVDIKYYRVMGSTSMPIDDFIKCPNYKTISLDEFKSIINNKKEA